MKYNLTNFYYCNKSNKYRILDICLSENDVVDRVSYYKIKYENIISKVVDTGYLHIDPKLKRWGFYDKNGDWCGRKPYLKVTNTR